MYKKQPIYIHSWNGMNMMMTSNFLIFRPCEMHDANYEKLVLDERLFREDPMHSDDQTLNCSLNASFTSRSPHRGNALLSSCLIGSPTRYHSRVEEIAFPPTTTISQESSNNTNHPSRIQCLLKSLREDVRDLKNRRTVTEPCPTGKRITRLPTKSLAPSQGTISPARQILQEIQMLLANAQDTINHLQDRVNISSDLP